MGLLREYRAGSMGFAEGAMRERLDAHKLCLVLAFTWASLFSSRSLVAQQSQVGNIVGEIGIARLGLPNKQILVSLQSRAADVNSVYSDGQGRFGFYSLPGGAYTIVIQDDDYEPANEQVILNLAVSTTAFARITLTPRFSKETKTKTSRVAGGNSGVVDPAELRRNFPKKAVKEYEKGLQASPHDPDSAALHFQKSIQLSPDFFPAHNELGRIFLARSDFDGAEKEFLAAARFNQSDAQAHLNLANVYLLTKKYDDALKQVEDGLRKDPNSAVGNFVLGSVYERTGKFPEAERALRHALESDSSMSKVRLELVNLYLRQSKKEEASLELRAFLKASPNDPLAPKAREVLGKLTSTRVQPPSD